MRAVRHFGGGLDICGKGNRSRLDMSESLVKKIELVERERWGRKRERKSDRKIYTECLLGEQLVRRQPCAAPRTKKQSVSQPRR